MRFTKKELHPVIFERLDEVRNAAWQGSTSPDYIKATSKHTNVWFAEYWKGFTAWSLGIVPALGLPFMTKEIFGKSGINGLFLVLGLGLWIGSGMWLYQKNKGLATTQEIESLRPIMEMSEFESIYLDCFLAVQNSPVLDASQRHQWCEALKQSLDRAIQLQGFHDELREMSAGIVSSEYDQEFQRLQQLIESSTDMQAKQMYQESLDILNSRASKIDGASVQIERVEAHLELTRQTFRRTRDTIKGLKVGQSLNLELNLEPLRANLQKVEVDASRIIAAIEELNQL